VGDPETDCRAVLERLYVYLDGEIAGEECVVIQVHLEECNGCLHRYGFERDFKELVRRKCYEGSVPGDLADRIRANIRAALGE
jgi:mycothiol system anti-sigma-R factor